MLVDFSSKCWVKKVRTTYYWEEIIEVDSASLNSAIRHNSFDSCQWVNVAFTYRNPRAQQIILDSSTWLKLPVIETPPFFPRSTGNFFLLDNDRCVPNTFTSPYNQIRRNCMHFKQSLAFFLSAHRHTHWDKHTYICKGWWFVNLRESTTIVMKRVVGSGLGEDLWPSSSAHSGTVAAKSCVALAVWPFILFCSVEKCK